MKKHFYHGLRFKLLMVSLVLLSIPLMGYRFIQEMELFLRETEDHHLQATAMTLARLIFDKSQKSTTITWVFPPFLFQPNIGR